MSIPVYLAVVAVSLAISFVIAAFAMWFFHNVCGINPVIVAGLLGVGYASNSFFKAKR